MLVYETMKIRCGRIRRREDKVREVEAGEDEGVGRRRVPGW